ncbi:hypothetical protein AB0N09_28045 [Streptomyces erythrochromogenes]|uniref:hypothetical protein n=1 Tax=Streptomyces erythrochromogenes TaxID=285574 RepID=UPI0034243911
MHHTPTMPTAVDPPECACTDCTIGATVPLDRAAPEQLAALLTGRMADRTDSGTEFTVTLSFTLTPGVSLREAAAHTVRAEFRSPGHHIGWDIDPSLLPH